MAHRDAKSAPDKHSAYAWLRGYPEEVDWYEAIEPRPLYCLIDDAVASYPDLGCTSFLGRKMSFRQVGAKVNEAAEALQRLGVVKGTRVGLFLPNAPTYIIYYFAILKAGGIVVNFNPLYTVEELTFQARDSGVELMVTLDLQILCEKVEALISDGVLPRAVIGSFTALLPPTKAALFRLFKGRDLARPLASPVTDRLLIEADILKPGSVPEPVEIDAEKDLAVLQYTGGTTGTPKGAMLTHYNVYANTEQVSRWAPHLITAQERFLGVLPFFHVFAMTVVMCVAIRKAAEIVILPRFDLMGALKLIQQTKPTVMPAVPTLFNAILNCPQVGKFDLSSLRFSISGGAPLPITVKKRFEALSGCSVVEGYGLSETSPVVTCNPVGGPVRDGSIGMPLALTVVSLRDLEDPSVEVSQGEKGEVCVKGPQVMAGYWQRPEETQNVFTTDGFLRTGDVARMDADGMFSIEDRIKDLIICSGYNVYPRQVEDAIYANPKVAEVTVIGIPDDYRGEAPKAFIRLKDGETATAEEIMEHLAKKLSKIELPAQIEFRDELPKTMIGKLSKKELREAEKQAHSG
ncbi:MAG: long-chain fatty acid--CoA ligase [Alphaproteobacteria bacterium]|nr:long-chain fatty acid--CoA ligase [Alphaproteobacteria bacterium]